MSKKSDDINKMTFEQAYTELEKTLAELEGGNLPLAESLALYERGMDLARQCNVQLDQAELTIQKLTPAGDLVDFEP